MPDERPCQLVRLNLRGLRVFTDVQLEDDEDVLVLVLTDGDLVVELPAIDQAAARAVRLLAVEVQAFADRVGGVPGGLSKR